MFRLPKVLTEAEVIKAEAELRALQRHAGEVVDPEADLRVNTRSTNCAGLALAGGRNLALTPRSTSPPSASSPWSKKCIKKCRSTSCAGVLSIAKA